MYQTDFIYKEGSQEFAEKISKQEAKVKKRIHSLIFDYGCVISKKQGIEQIEKMCTIFTTDISSFKEMYYQYRHEYDRATISCAQYWNLIAESFNHTLTPEELKTLVTIDIESWAQVDEKMLSFISETRSRVSRMAILSNIPPEILAYVRNNFSWIRLFDYQIFSCEIQKIKPEPQIYMYTVDMLNSKPDACLFIDDSDMNVEGAGEIGINTILYRSFEAFESELNDKYILATQETG